MQRVIWIVGWKIHRFPNLSCLTLQWNLYIRLYYFDQSTKAENILVWTSAYIFFFSSLLHLFHNPFCFSGVRYFLVFVTIRHINITAYILQGWISLITLALYWQARKWKPLIKAVAYKNLTEGNGSIAIFLMEIKLKKTKNKRKKGGEHSEVAYPKSCNEEMKLWLCTTSY